MSLSTDTPVGGFRLSFYPFIQETSMYFVLQTLFLLINEFTFGQIYSNDAATSNPQGKLTLTKNGLTKLNNRSSASVYARFLCPRILFVKF